MHADRLDAQLAFSTVRVPWFDGGRFLDDSEIRPAAFLSYATADYYIQDAASLLPLALLDVQQNEKICDLCAAPGGKASAIAERLGPDGFLLANESIRSRLDVLKYALARTGKPTHAVCSYDPERLVEHATKMFDAVLVDAPCSGQTLVAKNKRDENAFADNQIEHCALRQKRILLAAIKLLRPGGRLVYSTCTFSTEENEDQIRWLHSTFPNSWEPIEPVKLEEWKSSLEPGCYRLWPHRHRCAGGFAAALRLVKELDTDASKSKSTSEQTNRKSHAQSSFAKRPLEKKENQKARDATNARGEELLHGLGQLRDLTLDWRSGHAHCLTTGVLNALTELSKLHLQPSTVLIETGNHFVPTQALAMMDSRFFQSHKQVELNKSQAIEFMNGRAIARLEGELGATAGWSIAMWEGRPLGWFKSASNRWNNHLPAWARLNLDDCDPRQGPRYLDSNSKMKS